MLRTILLIVSAILIVIGFGPFVQAQTQGPITVSDAYAFATAEGTKTGAVFMTVKNAGGENDILISAETAKAEITEIHENFVDMEDGRMMMRKIPLISIPANGSVVLQPQGQHLMLLKLKEQLKLDGKFTVTLQFEKAGALVVPVTIVAPGAKGPTKKDVMNHDMDHMDHDMGADTGESHEGHH